MISALSSTYLKPCVGAGVKKYTNIITPNSVFTEISISTVKNTTSVNENFEFI